MKTKTIKTNKKAQFQVLTGFVFSLMIVAVVLAFMFLILSQTKAQIEDIEGINKTDASTFSSSYNNTVKVIEGAGEIAPWMSIVVIVGIGVVILSIVMVLKGYT